MDKIAEHIAKFNAPEGSEFFWVSFTKGKAEKHRNELYLECLMLKVDSKNWVWLSTKGEFNNLSCDWPYTLKHEQKGEQMKSIELSEEDLLTKKEREVLQKCLQNAFNEGNIPYLSGDALCKKLDKYLAENAKPIPTEPRWSEEEIREAFKLTPYLDEVLCNLKTPKPRLREMDIKEKEAWIVKLVFDYTDKSSGDKVKIKFKGKCFECGLLGFLQDDSDCTHYRVNSESPWLPIPQIEIESEK